MKKAGVLALLMLILVSSASAYGDYYRDVKVSRNELIKNSLLMLNANIDNGMSGKLKYTRLALFIPELGLREAVHFTVNTQQSQKLYLELPEDIEPGTYVVKITESNDRFRRVKY